MSLSHTIAAPSSEASSGGARAPWALVCLAAMTLLGAFLLFQVQPLVGKAVLPWLGGAPAAWTTAMLFFQSVLTAGYVFAFATSRYFRPALQAAAFIAVAAAALAAIPILPDASWKPGPDAEPITWTLALLAACVGLPYLVLSTTGPLTQQWFARSQPGRSPYRLYALSNLGSLVGLLSYPFLVEPTWSLPEQSRIWSALFTAYFVLSAACALLTLRAAPPVDQAERLRSLNGGASPRDVAGWLALSFAGSVMLLAATNHLCQDVATVPLLWVGPLVVYLLSFILSFDHPRWFHRPTWAAIALVTLIWGCFGAGHFLVEAIVVLAMLLSTCMLAHGELAARKPEPRSLTIYYVTISIGGALGGVLIGVVAPLVFRDYWEWTGATTIAYLPAAVVLARGVLDSPRLAPLWRKVLFLGSLVGGLVILLAIHAAPLNYDRIDRERNFYGVVSAGVVAETATKPEHLGLWHGRIRHGAQFVDPARRRQPTSYYGPLSGVGLVLNKGRELERPLRVACVGLGVGTLAAYGRDGDVYRFYEINPAVVRMAHEHFSFLRDSPAACDVVLGDARLSLERELPADGDAPNDRRFDAIVLDAFSGDAIPTHLLTIEALQLYLRHLRSDGLLAIHVSNEYLDLSPVVSAAARQLKLATKIGVQMESESELLELAHWILLTPTTDSPLWPGPTDAFLTELREPANVRAWTDSYSNLLQILR